ncbi:MAG: 3-deoxy-manno-octulosonate cytidylyltransferase [Candidatus Omnitrophica bacterium]|nr:3-deoxy-manno-octulosonate cytidylyltransferase [Candidatus Omnitrophota bacterium]
MDIATKVIGVIPARYESTRLSHKLLRNLKGKPLIQWTWEAAKEAHQLDELIIACDHSELKNCAESFGAQVVLTSPAQPSGTDRIAEAVSDLDVKIVVNIQADEPLIHPSIIDNLVQEMLANPDISMTTAKTRIDQDQEINNPNAVKVVCDKDGWAIYFSRFAIPYYRGQSTDRNYYKHLGIYAYTKDFLYTFKNLEPSALEKAEKLEQLRVLESGYRIKVIETKFNSWGVDTEEDLQQVERILIEGK